MTTNTPSYTLMTRQAPLQGFCRDLEKESAIAVDLEADSLFHYQEKVCLIQISTPRQNVVLDPLSLKDLSPLAPVLSNPRIRKVFHGADYDIRSLYRDFEIDVNGLFDTEIAARFLGISETGLAPLLKSHLGVIVEKKYQKRDWSERPLPAPMLAYAVHDTQHLLQLSRLLEHQLLEKDMLSCVLEECELLSNVRPIATNGNPLFLKFKGAGKLPAREMAVLESLLQLRDELARDRDRPPFKIIQNQSIMEIAQKMPTTQEGLKGIAGLSDKLIAMFGAALLERIEKALAFPEKDLPAFPKNRMQPMDARTSGKVRALKVWRKARANELGVEPPLVCTNAQIYALSREDGVGEKGLSDTPCLREWQKKRFGEEITRVLRTFR